MDERKVGMIVILIDCLTTSNFMDLWNEHGLFLVPLFFKRLNGCYMVGVKIAKVCTVFKFDKNVYGRF